MLGKLIGGIAGLAMGGPFGAVIGAALGHAADTGALPRPAGFALPGGAAPNPNIRLQQARMAAMLGQRDHAFAISVVVLSAKLAKCDGLVTARGNRCVQAAVSHSARIGGGNRPAVRSGARGQ